MDITLLKTGDVFYYDDYTSHNGKTHRHKCRVLFIGSESLFYDVCWDGINKWTFVPVRKQLTYYRFPLTHLHKVTNLTFDGFEAIDQKSTNKLFLQSPEILLKIIKDERFIKQDDDILLNLNSETIAFVPIGPKGGWLQPVLIETKGLTKSRLTNKVLECQNLDFIQTNEIVIDRIGLHNGVPSYNIKTH